MIVVLISLVIGIVIVLPFVFLIISASKNEKKFIENSKKIYPGMSKEDVVEILGDRYSQSYLKNDIEKLEWKWRHGGYSSRVAKGVYVHSGSFTRKVSVSFQNGKVMEVNSLNMD